MLYKLLILNAIFTSSCQLLNPKTINSQWQPLHSSNDVNCVDWPQGKRELQIHKIYHVGDKGFVVRSQDRLGRQIHNFRPWKDNGVSEESVKLNWGHNAQFLGTLNVKGSTYFAITRNVRGKTYIELRNLRTNVIQFSTDSIPFKIQGIKILSSIKGAWLVFKKVVKGKSLDELPLQVMELSFDEKNKIKFTLIKDLNISADAQAIQVNDSDLFIIWVDHSNKLKRFKFVIVSDSKKPIKYRWLSREINDKIESWKVSQHREGVLLSFVLGDTLVWENASLELYAMDSKGDHSWDRSYKIENEHVGDPIIIPFPTYSNLLMPKWLDGESTLSLYRVGSDDVQDKGYFGVFKEGTYHVMGVQGSEDSAFVITRKPHRFSKIYSICEIKD